MNKSELFTMKSIYNGMKSRCYNPNSTSYCYYGGLGISVCDRWKNEYGFKNFCEDMGFRPTIYHSLDRIDVNGDYCPENCRWATPKEQGSNKRRTILINTSEGYKLVSEIAQKLNISSNMIYKHLKNRDNISKLYNNVCLMNLKPYKEAKKSKSIRVLIENSQILP